MDGIVRHLFVIISAGLLFWSVTVTGPAFAKEATAAYKVARCPKQNVIADNLLKEFTVDESYKDPKKPICVIKATKPKEFGDFIFVINTAGRKPALIFKFGPTGDYYIDWVRFRDLNSDGRNEILFYIQGEPMQDDDDLYIIFSDRSRTYKLDSVSGGRHAIERLGRSAIPVLIVSYNEAYQQFYGFKPYFRDRLFTFNGNQLIERSPKDFPDYLKKKIRSFEEVLRSDEEVKKKYELSEDISLWRKNYMRKARKYYEELVNMQKKK